MRNIKLTIQYDGSRYKGWQRLGDTDMTIQGKIENVLSKMTDDKIEIIGSGRTDGGVHAYGQVANFKTHSKMSVWDIKDYLYQYLPEDIVVTHVEEVHDRFHARYNVQSKTYVYKIWNTTYHDPFLRRHILHIPERLDIMAMEKAATHFVGEKDFSSFTSLKSKKKTKVREIYALDIKKEGKLIEMTFKGNGFMQHMVRIMVGTLLEVGKGQLKADAIVDIMENKDRTLAGPTVPAQGLFLKEVNY